MPTTTEMDLILPTPTMDEGTWGETLNTALTVVDGHDHTPGKGVPVPSTALNVVADIQLNSFGLTEVREVKLDDLGSAQTGVAHFNALQSADSNLYYVNGSGTAVQITDGSSLATALSSPALPAGATIPYAGTSAPTGWLLCDGSAVSRSTYATLFGVVGTVWGVGDGSTTFNLPNMNGRVAVGTGSYTDPVSGPITRSLAQSSGAEAHVLITNEIPSHNHSQNPHNHSITDPGHAHEMGLNRQDGANINGYLTDVTASVKNTDTRTDNSVTGITVDNTTATNNVTGGGLSHNNMQPWAGLLYIIKT